MGDRQKCENNAKQILFQTVQDGNCCTDILKRNNRKVGKQMS